MERVAIIDARERLDELLDRVAEGEDIVLVRDGIPVAKLTRHMPLENRFGRSEGTEEPHQFSEDYIG